MSFNVAQFPLSYLSLIRCKCSRLGGMRRRDAVYSLFVVNRSSGSSKTDQESVSSFIHVAVTTTSITNHRSASISYILYCHKQVRYTEQLTISVSRDCCATRKNSTVTVITSPPDVEMWWSLYSGIDREYCRILKTVCVHSCTL